MCMHARDVFSRCKNVVYGDDDIRCCQNMPFYPKIDRRIPRSEANRSASRRRLSHARNAIHSRLHKCKSTAEAHSDVNNVYRRRHSILLWNKEHAHGNGRPLAEIVNLIASYVIG